MDAINIALIVIGLLLAAGASIVGLVRAFQTGVLWGLSYLLVPLANLAFLIVHWDRAKGSFFACLFGIGMMIFGVVRAGPEDFKKSFWKEFSRQRGMEESQDDGALTDRIQRQRNEIETLESQVHSKGAELAKQFQALDKRRKDLKKGDAAAIQRFNVEAEAYTAQNTAHKLLASELDSARKQLQRLLDDRSTVRASSGSAGSFIATQSASSKQVIMYTTSTCPACIAAKQYLSRKGIPYDERDLERSKSAAEEFAKLGGRAVPLIVVGNEQMVGLNPERLEEMLAN